MTSDVAVAGLPARSRSRLQSSDIVLLVAFLAMAGLGAWTRCLLVNDGAVFLVSAWLGDAWDLYFSESAARSLSIILTFGPAWGLRWALDLSAEAFVLAAHLLYFAVPLILWLVIRAIEPHVVFSRLFLAAALAFVYFPSELTVGAGLWLLWLAMVAHPLRSSRQALAATAGLGIGLVFTHPATMAMSLLYLIAAAVLAKLGRPSLARTLLPAALMVLLLLLGFIVTSRLLSPANPTMLRALAANGRGFFDPRWWMASLAYSPMLLALWLLILWPGVEVSLRRRLQRWQLAAIGLLGLWFAFNGVTSVTWVQARHTGAYALVLAIVLALAAPADWPAAARRPLAWFAAVAMAAALSYGIDLVLLERSIARHLVPGYHVVEEAVGADWPAERQPRSLRRTLFKWTAGEDYLRDVVVPAYDWFFVTLAFQTFFMSDRSAVLFHPVPDGYWTPFQCAPVRRALAEPHDERDTRLLRFVLAEGYCVP